jgi:hypothetical protein
MFVLHPPATDRQFPKSSHKRVCREADVIVLRRIEPTVLERGFGRINTIAIQLPYHTANLHTREKLFQAKSTLSKYTERLERKTFSFFARSSKLD